MELTQERLKELLDYSPETGLFYWLIDRPPLRKAGDTAGALRDTGYISISVDDRACKAHQLAWLWMTGGWPPRFIDHRDTDKANNRWLNLRLATKSQNQANMRAPKNNKSGFKGVSRYRAGDRRGLPWQASIGKDGKSFCLGHFETAEQAHMAYAIAARKLFGEFARTN